MSQQTITLELSNWQTTPEIKNTDPNILRYCRTGLKDYVLVALQYQTSKMKTKEFNQFCDNTSVVELIKKGIKLYEKELKFSADSDAAQTLPLTQSGLFDFFCHIFVRELDAALTSNGVTLLKVATAVAKFRNFDKTQRSDYLDIPIILDLKDLKRKYNKEYQQNKKKSDKKKWRSKELTYPQLFEVVDHLLACCAPYTSKVSQSSQSPGKLMKGRERSLEAVVQAYQIHLIVKILVHAPWRQGEIRQWAMGKTLFRRDDGSGQPFYDVILEEHKLSKLKGELARKLPMALTADLDDWINIWRPKVVKAVQTLEGWVEFCGYKLEDVEKLQHRLEAAKLGQSKRRVKDQQEYIKRLEHRLHQLQHRIAAWETAKANLEVNDTLFLGFGRAHPESFGIPLKAENFCSSVTTALSKATKYLFGETKSLNPHRFRHIAIKHCLEIQGNLEALAAYMNHSDATQKLYLEQIFSTYNYTKDFVDGWWKKKL